MDVTILCSEEPIVPQRALRMAELFDFSHEYPTTQMLNLASVSYIPTGVMGDTGAHIFAGKVVPERGNYVAGDMLELKYIKVIGKVWVGDVLRLWEQWLKDDDSGNVTVFAVMSGKSSAAVSYTTLGEHGGFFSSSASTNVWQNDDFLEVLSGPRNTMIARALYNARAIAFFGGRENFPSVKKYEIIGGVPFEKGLNGKAVISV
jgi:hypothetical protein